MRTDKLQRRIRILRWIRRVMGLNGLVQMSIYLDGSKKVTVEYANHMERSYPYIQEMIVNRMTREMMRAGLVKLEKGTEGDDYIHNMETWTASVKIIIP